MKLFKRLFGGLFVLLVLLVMVGFVALQLVDADEIKTLATEAVNKETGRTLLIGGDVKLGLDIDDDYGLHPSATLTDVSFSNAEWAGSDPMFEAQYVSVGVALMPLMGGETVIDYVKLRDATIRLQKNASGDANWEFNTAKTSTLESSEPATPDAPSSSNDDAASPITLSRAELENVTLIYKDAVSGTNETVTLSSATIEDNDGLSIDAESQYKMATVSAHVSAASVEALTGQTLDYRINVSAPGLTAVSEGTSAAGTFSGDLSFDMKNTQGLSKLTGGDVPALPAVSAKGSFSGTSEKVTLPGLTLTYGEATVLLKATADLASTIPNITATLTSESLNIDTLAAPAASTAAPNADSAKKAPKENPASDRVIPNIALPMDAIATLPVRATVNAAITKLIAGGQTYDNVKAKIIAAPGSITLDTSPIALAGGTVEADMAITGATAAGGTLSIKALAEKVTIDRIMKLAGASDVPLTGGTSSFALDLKGTGADLHSVIASSQGSTQMMVNGTQYDSPNIEKLKAFLAFLGGGKSVDKIDVSCAFAAADITGGVAKTKAMTLQTSAAKVDGNGSISLPSETLDLTLRPRSSLVGAADLVPPLLLSGKWIDPSVSLDKQSTLLTIGKLVFGTTTGGLGFAALAGLEAAQKTSVFKDNPCVKQAQTAPEEKASGSSGNALQDTTKGVEGTVKNIRDAFEGKNEDGTKTEDKTERVKDGINAIKGLFGQ